MVRKGQTNLLKLVTKFEEAQKDDAGDELGKNSEVSERTENLRSKKSALDG